MRPLESVVELNSGLPKTRPVGLVYLYQSGLEAEQKTNGTRHQVEHLTL